MCLFSLSCFNCIRLAIYKQASLKSNECVKSIDTSSRWGGHGSLLVDMIFKGRRLQSDAGQGGEAEQAGIMQGSSLSFAAEGWLLLICCSRVICRGKQTPRTVVTLASHARWKHPRPSSPSHPPNAVTHTHPASATRPALWVICPSSYRGT